MHCFPPGLTPDAEDVANDSLNRPYSPYAGRGFPTQVYFGDTHLHTGMSMDAGAFGNRLGLEEAYQFARGDEVVSSSGIPARLSRPLDFLVVADHAANLGLAPMIAEGNPDLLATEDGAELHQTARLNLADSLIGLGRIDEAREEMEGSLAISGGDDLMAAGDEEVLTAMDFMDMSEGAQIVFV